MSDALGAREKQYPLDFLKAFVVNNEREKNNKRHIFYKLSEDTVEKAEKELCMKFPEQLKRFYAEIGYGYFCDKEKTDINLLMSPQHIVDYYKGNGNYAYAEDREFVRADEFVFFELDCSSHMKIKLEGENAGKVFFGRKEIAKNLEEFIAKLDEYSGYYF